MGKRERGNRKLITKETRTIRGSLLGSAGSLIKGRFKIRTEARNLCRTKWAGYSASFRGAAVSKLIYAIEYYYCCRSAVVGK